MTLLQRRVLLLPMEYFPRKYLYKRLNELNISQLEFSLRTDTNLRYIARLLMGQRGSQLPVLTWFKIADALEMDIGTLMNLEKEYQIERLRLIKSKCPTEKK